jgi:hypothetical protein
MSKILKSYFYWTYPRGCFHYDIMVTLILAFIFVTPHIPGWSYGDKPSPASGPHHSLLVEDSGDRGFLVIVQASDVSLNLNTTDSNQVVKKALRKAIEPVTGDAVQIEYWETAKDTEGNWVWKVWAHR